MSWWNAAPNVCSPTVANNNSRFYMIKTTIGETTAIFARAILNLLVNPIKGCGASIPTKTQDNVLHSCINLRFSRHQHPIAFVSGGDSCIKLMHNATQNTRQTTFRPVPCCYPEEKQQQHYMDIEDGHTFSIPQRLVEEKKTRLVQNIESPIGLTSGTSKTSHNNRSPSPWPMACQILRRILKWHTPQAWCLLFLAESPAPRAPRLGPNLEYDPANLVKRYPESTRLDRSRWICNRARLTLICVFKSPRPGIFLPRQ